MQEFQVIIMAAGKGSRMTEITARKSKSLLPVGSQPMVYFPIKMFERFGFAEVMLVVQDSAKSEIEVALSNTDLQIHVNIVTITDDDWGTVDTLRHISQYIKSDMIVTSCDLISTIDIRYILDLHRKHDSSLTALYFTNNNETLNSFVTPGHKTKSKIEKDLVGIDPMTKRLIFTASASDFDEILPLNRALLQKHGRITLHSNLLDGHFFILKRWILKYIQSEKNVATLKGELIPNIIKKQLSRRNRGLKEKTINSDQAISGVNTDDEESTSDIFEISRKEELALSMSSFNDHTGDLNDVYSGDQIKCYAYIANNEFGARTNTISDYNSINKQILKYLPILMGNLDVNYVSSNAEILSEQVEKKSCCIREGCHIDAKTSVKSSHIGCNGVIKSKSRLIDCIIMNNVTINEQCTLTNCIICDDVVVEANSTLKNCIIGSQHTVPMNSVHTHDVLTQLDRLLEI